MRPNGRMLPGTFLLPALGRRTLGFRHRQGGTVKRIALPLLALLLGFGLVHPSVAHAVLMQVNFTVLTNASDPIYGNQTVSGYFTYDSSIAPAGGGTLNDIVNGLNISDLSLTLAGHTYSTADAGVSYLAFNSGGNLTDWFMGGTVGGINGIGSSGTPDFVISPGFPVFDYNYPGSSNSAWPGTISSWSVTTVSNPPAAAEPGTLALLLQGLLPLGLMLRRRNKS